jgi:hypothetical protein
MKQNKAKLTSHVYFIADDIEYYVQFYGAK